MIVSLKDGSDKSPQGLILAGVHSRGRDSLDVERFQILRIGRGEGGEVIDGKGQRLAYWLNYK